MEFNDASFYARCYLIVTTLIYMKNILNNFRPIIQYLLHYFFNFNKYIIKNDLFIFFSATCIIPGKY